MPSPIRPGRLDDRRRLVAGDEQHGLPAPEMQLAVAAAKPVGVDDDDAVPDPAPVVELADPAHDDDPVARRSLLPGVRRGSRHGLRARARLRGVVEAVARGRELGEHDELTHPRRLPRPIAVTDAVGSPRRRRSRGRAARLRRGSRSRRPCQDCEREPHGGGPRLVGSVELRQRDDELAPRARRRGRERADAPERSRGTGDRTGGWNRRVVVSAGPVCRDGDRSRLEPGAAEHVVHARVDDHQHAAQREELDVIARGGRRAAPAERAVRPTRRRAATGSAGRAGPHLEAPRGSSRGLDARARRLRKAADRGVLARAAGGKQQVVARGAVGDHGERGRSWAAPTRVRRRGRGRCPRSRGSSPRIGARARPGATRRRDRRTDLPPTCSIRTTSPRCSSSAAAEPGSTSPSRGVRIECRRGGSSDAASSAIARRDERLGEGRREPVARVGQEPPLPCARGAGSRSHGGATMVISPTAVGVYDNWGARCDCAGSTTSTSSAPTSSGWCRSTATCSGCRSCSPTSARRAGRASRRATSRSS